jgi:hypothetical protein
VVSKVIAMAKKGPSSSRRFSVVNGKWNGWKMINQEE